MAHPLDGPRLKIRRAEREIERLTLIEESFQEDSHYRVVQAEINPKTGQDVYRVRAGKIPDPMWGVWIGEIAHNLRSALDGLIHQLALLNLPSGRTPTRISQFPVFLVGRTTKMKPVKPGRQPKELIAHFHGMRREDGLGMLVDLRPEHQAMIEQLQPYNRGRGGKMCPLFWLREMNNMDKHQIILVTAVRAGIISSAYSGSGLITDRPKFSRFPTVLKDGTKFMESPAGMQVYPSIVPAIAFGDGVPSVRRRHVCTVLATIAEDVSEIIEGFAPEFF